MYGIDSHWLDRPTRTSRQQAVRRHQCCAQRQLSGALHAADCGAPARVHRYCCGHGLAEVPNGEQNSTNEQHAVTTGSPEGSRGPTHFKTSSSPSSSTPDQHIGRAKSNVILYWTTNYGSADFSFGFGAAPFVGCPVNNCVTTNNRTMLDSAAAVLFHGRSMSAKHLPKRRRADQRFVFVLREPPTLTYIGLRPLDYFFNTTMTYSRSADIYFPYGKTVPGEQEGEVPLFSNRKVAAAWVVSHCPSHSKREVYVKKLARSLQVDIYGKCGTLRCPSDKRKSAPRIDCYRSVAATHFFYLSFENSLCEDYITEKFWLALRAGLVPVVRGPPPEAYQRVAPPHSFIHVQDFQSVSGLAAYLSSLMHNRTAYESYFAWRSSYRVRFDDKVCDLCAYLSQEQPTKAVRLSEVWGTDQHCVSGDALNAGS
ncbi:alpha-(1,3)-fucosyltransferase 7-like [Pollicipes pollicipes]|uniref:alpha-(1,3)-fucosyltransferase 7-like n=1 Tax=Pollicipes pollicipes TaxID=41117 RepID=UPI0018854E14|nr:alpha-(1,3)-fucosyltransferase 7-like [Pollicipes pollicipes]